MDVRKRDSKRQSFLLLGPVQSEPKWSEYVGPDNQIMTELQRCIRCLETSEVKRRFIVNKTQTDGGVFEEYYSMAGIQLHLCPLWETYNINYNICVRFHLVRWVSFFSLHS